MSRLYRVFRKVARRDPGWAWLGWMLTPLSMLYSLLAKAHRTQYETDRLSSIHLRTPVVGVGNIELGGVGKTPITAFLARRLSEAGVEVAVVARELRGGPEGPSEVRPGSGARSSHSDEARLLALELNSTARVYAGRRKWEAAGLAERSEPDLILVDDAFQHHKLHRDLDVVVLDFHHPYGTGGLLPVGTLREPPSVLSEADYVWVNRVDPGRSCHWVARQVAQNNWKARLVYSRMVPESMELYDGEKVSAQGVSVLAFCGIGQPESFGTSLEEHGCEVLELIPYPDHYQYSARDVAALEARRSELGADFLVTTRKDAVKIPRRLAIENHLCILKVGLEVTGELQDLLQEITLLTRHGKSG
ncbi:tetraacyldisaccharide 4'-kinase [Candidatus Fermentibacteria bacterium]|nr:tetraacyldisaccharide 4'-kinase [Candidatus Fermentibacteria bacterium]